MEKIIEKRLKERENAIQEAEKFVQCVSKKLRIVQAWLFGSYARGDFNEWSDIDVLIVVRDSLPKRPIDRIDLVMECLEECNNVEPVIVTVDEFEKMRRKRNPIVQDIEKHGIRLL